MGLADELDRLADGIRTCRRCRLWRSRTLAVPGEGTPYSRVILLGEAPGAREDATGRPFVGQSGRYFGDLLAGLGLGRQTMFITSSVKCRPPKNRLPRPDELEICRRTWLEKQVAIIDPRVIVALGRTAALQATGLVPPPLMLCHGNLLPPRPALARSAEQEALLGPRVCLITYHPAGARRSRIGHAALRADLAKLKEIIGNGR